MTNIYSKFVLIKLAQFCNYAKILNENKLENMNPIISHISYNLKLICNVYIYSYK